MRSDHNSHQAIHEVASKLLTEYREKLLIPPSWSIQLEINCPEDMPSMDGCMDYKVARYGSFRMALRCNLSPEKLEWIIAHELLEALLSEYGDFTDQFIDGEKSNRLRSYLRDQHGIVRDQFIEHMLHVLIGKDRPDVFPPAHVIHG